MSLDNLPSGVIDNAYRAVETAINLGCTAEDFKRLIAWQWGAVLAEKARADAKVFANER